MRVKAFVCSNVNIHAIEADFKQSKHPFFFEISIKSPLKTYTTNLIFQLLISSSKGHHSYEKDDNAPKLTVLVDHGRYSNFFFLAFFFLLIYVQARAINPTEMEKMAEKFKLHWAFLGKEEMKFYNVLI